MYFADFAADAAPAPAKPSGLATLAKVGAPAGAGFLMGGPIGGAIGLGVGLFLNRGGGGGAIVPASTGPRTPPSTQATSQGLTPAQIAAVSAGAPGQIVGELKEVTGTVKVVAPIVSGAVSIAEAAGASAAGAAIIVFDAAAVALAIADMLGMDPIAFKPMWDALSPAQQQLYIYAQQHPEDPTALTNAIQAGALGAGTGAKQIYDPSTGLYTTVGRTASGQVLRRPAGAVGVDCSVVPDAAECQTDTTTGTRPTARYMLGGFDDGCDGDCGDQFADVTYVVEEGDTLTSIALAHGLCTKGPGNTAADWADCMAAAERIRAYNFLGSADLVSVGEPLTLPDVQVQVVNTATGPVAVPIAKATSALPLLLGLGILGAFLAFGRR